MFFDEVRNKNVHNITMLSDEIKDQSLKVAVIKEHARWMRENTKNPHNWRYLGIHISPGKFCTYWKSSRQKVWKLDHDAIREPEFIFVHVTHQITKPLPEYDWFHVSPKPKPIYTTSEGATRNKKKQYTSARCNATKRRNQGDWHCES